MVSPGRLRRALPLEAIYEATHAAGLDALPSREALSAARNLFYSPPTEYLRASPEPPVFAPLPGGAHHPYAPEFAFCGRSNSGKSSLINAVAGRPGMMIASKTPGRTQKLHIADVSRGGTAARIIDLPGYGLRAWKVFFFFFFFFFKNKKKRKKLTTPIIYL
jgi:hypothetical protein